MLNNNLIKNIVRKILLVPSLLFSPNSKPSQYENKIINKIKNKKITFDTEISFEGYEKFKTHVLSLLRSDKFYMFLRDDQISNVMFVNNRLFIIKELLYVIRKLKYKNIELIKENNIGRPYRFFLFPYTSGNKIHHLYHLLKFYDFKNQILNKESINNYDLIIEFGGGYGNNANLIQRLGYNKTYIIYDLEIINLLQEYYLNCVNKNKKINNSIIEINQINLVSNVDTLKNIFRNFKKILFISCWALSETPLILRNQFEDIISNSDTLIASQERFYEVNNFYYFENLLSKRKKKKFVFQSIGLEKHCYFFSSTEKNN